MINMLDFIFSCINAHNKPKAAKTKNSPLNASRIKRDFRSSIKAGTNPIS